MSDPVGTIYLRKAEDSLAGAMSECAVGRFDNCANRAYYGCCQAAVAALVQAQIGPQHQAGQWGHEFVQVRFVGDLINRRKRYPAMLRETLIKGFHLRLKADYADVQVKPIQALRGLARAQAFVAAVAEAGEVRR